MDTQSWRIPAVLSVVLALLLVCSVVTWQQRRPDSSAVVAVASQQARNFFTLNHTTIERDIDRVLALSTGEFKKEYASRRKVIVADVRARKLQVVATLPTNGAAVEYLSGSTARVLVAVDAHSRTEDESVGKRFRSRVTLRKVDGAWLVSKLEQV